MSVKNYYSVDGEIMGDSVAGDYMRDALGNVTGTCDHDTGAVRNTYRYKPSGELLSKTGNFPDPKFMHVGVHGIRDTALPHSEEYMRARHYSSKEGRFTTVDPLWPGEPAYGYAAGNPVNRIDPSGLGCPPAEPPDPCKGCENAKDLCKFIEDAFPGMAQAGYTACCGKRRVTCVNSQLFPPGFPKPDKDKISKCVLAHEDYHKRRPGVCTLRGSNKPSPCGFWGVRGNQATVDKEECRAYQREMDCAMKEYPNACKTNRQSTGCLYQCDICKSLKEKCKPPSLWREKDRLFCRKYCP